MNGLVSPEVVIRSDLDRYRSEVHLLGFADTASAERLAQMVFCDAIGSHAVWHEGQPDDPMTTDSEVVAIEPDAEHGHDPRRFTMRQGSSPGYLKIVPSLERDPELGRLITLRLTEAFDATVIVLPKPA